MFDLVDVCVREVDCFGAVGQVVWWRERDTTILDLSDKLASLL